ncbi:MAG: hypothetical protein A4E57_04651 [Syntrophorhabdaceae bacterium PtaU1.Bin034]|nr:MAG: hypothetical protein A4E57_04651 [Syntrophorhabdaceae bacterium PtaU1.Bin034]
MGTEEVQDHPLPFGEITEAAVQGDAYYKGRRGRQNEGYLIFYPDLAVELVVKRQPVILVPAEEIGNLQGLAIPCSSEMRDQRMLIHVFFEGNEVIGRDDPIRFYSRGDSSLFRIDLVVGGELGGDEAWKGQDRMRGEFLHAPQCINLAEKIEYPVKVTVIRPFHLHPIR